MIWISKFTFVLGIVKLNGIIKVFKCRRAALSNRKALCKLDVTTNTFIGTYLIFIVIGDCTSIIVHVPVIVDITSANCKVNCFCCTNIDICQHIIGLTSCIVTCINMLKVVVSKIFGIQKSTCS